MPIILATQEAEIRRIIVQSQQGQLVWEILSWKYLTHADTKTDMKTNGTE
jgi:hypothetical protein